MDRVMQWRRIVLFGVAAITAVFSFYPTADKSMLSPNRARKLPDTARAKVTPAESTGVETPDVTNDDILDPFAPRGWQPPPPPVVPTQVTAVVAAVPVAPIGPMVPAGPPPLPYKFMGTMNDDGNIIVYLSHGDQALVVRNGETLEGTYKVLTIDSQHIEFEHLPTGEKQSLPIPASEN